jgi:alpha-tubulin suppressor-like RCC1 family protein
VKVNKLACGANHTIALTLEGKVFFWGQYEYPLKENEKPKYGRILSPKLH